MAHFRPIKRPTNVIKSTADLFQSPKFDRNPFGDTERHFLDENGYLVIENVPVVIDNLEELRLQADHLIKAEGDKGGWEGKEQHYKDGKDFEEGANRLGNLFNKHEVFRKLIDCPEILLPAHHVIQNEIRMGGADLREPKHNGPMQQLHIDWLPREREDDPFGGVVAIVFLDDVEIENGATRAYPGSHKKLGWADQHMDVEKEREDFPDATRITTKAGSIFIMNLNLHHAGCTNFNGKRRRSIFINVRERSIPQLLNFKKFMDPDIVGQLSEEQQFILGVRDCDPTDQTYSLGPGDAYRAKYGDKRKA